MYYVTPHSPNPDCPSGEPCLTINEYAQGDHFLGEVNITFLFLNGMHNLTIRDFEIGNKTSLKMAPINSQAEVVIQLFNGTSMIILRNVLWVEFSNLKFISHTDNISECLSVSEIRHLLFTQVLTEFCQLCLNGVMNATLHELVAYKTYFFSPTIQTSYTVAIQSSDFNLSSISVGDNSADHKIITSDTTTSSLSLENSSLCNSLVKVNLQSPIVYELSILNTSIISQDSKASETGIILATANVTILYALIKGSNIIGNANGILVTADEDSHVQLSVDKCLIENNGEEPQLSGGIAIFTSNSMININITSTILSGNKLAQIGFLQRNSGNSIISVFDSTISDTPPLTGALAAGANFQVHQATSIVECYSTLNNLTQNHFENNTYGVLVKGENCKLDMLFNGSNFTSSHKTSNDIDNSGIGLKFSSSGEGKVNVSISNCYFSHNQGGAIDFEFSSSVVYILNTGANFQVHQAKTTVECYSTLINVTQNHFENNTYGVLVNGENCKLDMLFNGNNITSSHKTSNDIDNSGIGLKFSSSGEGKVNVSISNCYFSHNQGGAIYFIFTSSVVSILNTVIVQNKNGLLIDILQRNNITMAIRDSIFQQNSRVSLGLPNLLLDSSTTTTIRLSIENVTFFNNTNFLVNGGIIQVDGSVGLSILDACAFRQNHGTVIQALMTSVTFSGIIVFEDNVAFQGAAISLSYSMLRFKVTHNSNTSILFHNNEALNTGGSIFVDRSLSVDPETGSICFYVLEGVTEHELKRGLLTLVFTNNTAHNGGIDIYGATPNSHCLVNLGFSSRYSSDIEDYIFKTSLNTSPVSSDPRRVCLCDGSQILCTNLSHIFYNTTRYPGEVFTLSVAVVGLQFGTVTGPVYANLLPGDKGSNSSLEKDQHIRQVGYKACIELNFTVNSVNPTETIVLTANNTVISQTVNSSDVKSAIQRFHSNNFVVPLFLMTVPVYINVTLEPCPPGFSRSKSGKCECSVTLKSINIFNCAIYNGTLYITRSGNQWIWPLPSHKSILVSNYCPFNYCKKKTVSLNISAPDEQCDLNHSGILCGACLTNLSLAIGSSRCLNCPDNYRTLLLIAFAAAGIVLVLFIKILDLTVTTGTLNGLLLYSNIIWANQSILFPEESETSHLLKFLKTFIAWLNLDLGIETCFIQYLDGYWKTWLQFVFPAYIWLIAGMIILVSHYSIRATKIFGDSSVSVLATLFLLTYAKLLRIILIILEFTPLTYPDELRIVWSFDGNVPYFGLKHSFLFVAAITILLLLWLPCTFVLLFVQCLRKQSHYCCLKWINKISPIFDSFLGPLKVNHHYWIGLGLLARLVLFLLTAVTSTTVPFIAMLMISLTASLFCLQVLSVYKQWLLSVLETCFLLNMGLFSTAVLFIEAQGGSKDSLACTSIGLTFTLFLAIIGYHVWRRYHSWRGQKKSYATDGYTNIDSSSQTLEQPQDPTPHRTISYQEVSVSELRESLLEDDKM